AFAVEPAEGRLGIGIAGIGGLLEHARALAHVDSAVRAVDRITGKVGQRVEVPRVGRLLVILARLRIVARGIVGAAQHVADRIVRGVGAQRRLADRYSPAIVDLREELADEARTDIRLARQLIALLSLRAAEGDGRLARRRDGGGAGARQ